MANDVSALMEIDVCYEGRYQAIYCLIYLECYLKPNPKANGQPMKLHK